MNISISDCLGLKIEMYAYRTYRKSSQSLSQNTFIYEMAAIITHFYFKTLSSFSLFRCEKLLLYLFFNNLDYFLEKTKDCEGVTLGNCGAFISIFRSVKPNH